MATEAIEDVVVGHDHPNEDGPSPMASVPELADIVILCDSAGALGIDMGRPSCRAKLAVQPNALCVKFRRKARLDLGWPGTTITG